jgi:hypothetical protein
MVGRNGRGGHQWGKASSPGKVVGGGTHRGDSTVWRRREAVGVTEFNDDEALRWGTTVGEGSGAHPGGEPRGGREEGLGATQCSAEEGVGGGPGGR